MQKSFSNLILSFVSLASAAYSPALIAQNKKAAKHAAEHQQSAATAPSSTPAPSFTTSTQDSSFPGDTLRPISILSTKSKFIYKLTTTEYITNENDYLLDSKADTAYVIFTKTAKPGIYQMRYHGDEEGKTPWKSGNLLQQEMFEVRFGSRGDIDSLINWKHFRDILASSMSTLVKAGAMKPNEFEANIKTLTNERYVRRLAMEDINYLFELCNDTLVSNIEYLRIKPIRSPFTSDDFFIQGNLTLEKAEGARNTWFIKTHNQAGPMQKPQLLADCTEYVKKNANHNQPLGEITRVGLNNEVEYTYNSAKRAMIKAIFSDVLAINFQSRGNIRLYQLWDVY